MPTGPLAPLRPMWGPVTLTIYVNFSGKWTNSVPHYGSVNYDSSFSNQNNFTALVGLDVDLGMNFKANIQGTFVSSTALTIGVSYCF